MWLVWLGSAVVFALIELAIPTFFTVFFSIGSIAALLTSFSTSRITIQGTVFLLVSIILTIFTRPIAKKFLTNTPLKTNLDSIEGAIGIVIIEINNLEATGQIKLNGQVWSALSSTETIIPVGTKVRVIKVIGVKTVVEQINI